MSVADGRLTLRPAGEGDARRLLDWANDASTRAASFDREPITWEEHVEWLDAVLADPGRRLWIGQVAGRAVGQVRVDRAPDGTGLVSIGLAPEARGRGLGRALLAAGLDAAARELGIHRARAIVRADNLPSRRLFEAAGFTRTADITRPGSLPAHEYELELAAETDSRPEPWTV